MSPRTWRGMTRAWIGAMALAIAGGSVVAPATAQDRDFEPVTDAMLADPDPADWLHWRRTLDGWGYSPLDQIDRGNVHQLGLAWSWTMAPGIAQATPLVYDGVMYLPSPLNVVQALDAVTGDPAGSTAVVRELARRLVPSPHPVDRHLRRQDLPEHERRPHRRPRRPDRRRGLGPHRRRHPARLPLHQRAHRRRRADHRGHDRLRALQGRHLLHLGPRRADGGRAVADVDHRPARRPRRRHLGRPAGDVPGRRRRVDSRQLRPRHRPHLLVDLAGQAVGAAVARHRGDALYTNSALALDPATGASSGTTSSCRARPTIWTTCSRASSSTTGGGSRCSRWASWASCGSSTGPPAGSSPPTTSATRPWSTSTPRRGGPPTGRHHPRAGPGARVLPRLPGHPQLARVGLPPRHRDALHPHSPDLRPGHLQRGGARAAPDRRPLLLRQPAVDGVAVGGRLPHPKSPDHDGHLVAMDIETGEVRWRHSTRLRSLAAALTTAGGLVVTADGDRYLYIMDADTGDVLFRTRFPSPPQGFPITYAVDGRQYLAVPVGGDGCRERRTRCTSSPCRSRLRDSPRGRRGMAPPSQPPRAEAPQQAPANSQRDRIGRAVRSSGRSCRPPRGGRAGRGPRAPARGEGARHQRPQAARLEPREEPVEVGAVRLGVPPHEGAPEHPDDLAPLEEHEVGAHAGDGAAREAHHEEPASQLMQRSDCSKTSPPTGS